MITARLLRIPESSPKTVPDKAGTFPLGPFVALWAKLLPLFRRISDLRSVGQMIPKGLLMFIPLSPKGVYIYIYTPYKVGWKPRKPRSMKKRQVLPPQKKLPALCRWISGRDRQRALRDSGRHLRLRRAVAGRSAGGGRRLGGFGCAMDDRDKRENLITMKHTYCIHIYYIYIYAYIYIHTYIYIYGHPPRAYLFIF